MHIHRVCACFSPSLFRVQLLLPTPLTGLPCFWRAYLLGGTHTHSFRFSPASCLYAQGLRLAMVGRRTCQWSGQPTYAYTQAPSRNISRPNPRLFLSPTCKLQGACWCTGSRRWPLACRAVGWQQAHYSMGCGWCCTQQHLVGPKCELPPCPVAKMCHMRLRVCAWAKF